MWIANVPLCKTQPEQIFTPKRCSPLKNIHPWKIFTPEKYSPLEIFTPWKCSPWKYSPLKNINVNIELLSQWTVWVSQVGSAALEKVLSILSLYSIWCWRKCFGTIHGWAWTAMKKTKKGFAVSSFYDFLKIAAIVQRYSEIKLPLRKETLNFVTLNWILRNS